MTRLTLADVQNGKAIPQPGDIVGNLQYHGGDPSDLARYQPLDGSPVLSGSIFDLERDGAQAASAGTHMPIGTRPVLSGVKMLLPDIPFPAGIALRQSPQSPGAATFGAGQDFGADPGRFPQASWQPTSPPWAQVVPVADHEILNGTTSTTRQLGRQDTIKQNSVTNNLNVAPNPMANPNAPSQENPEKSQVGKYATLIKKASDATGVDEDLIKTAMYMETTHGTYWGAGPLADYFGVSKSILPMNLNHQYWGDTFGTRAQLNDPYQNILAGADMIRRIIANYDGPAPVDAIFTLYNSINKTKVSDYGARAAQVYKTQAWNR